MPTSTRQALLQALSAAGGDYVSGQQLADTLGVSRAAVHKAAAALSAQGYALEAVSRRGYRLAGGDPFCAEAVGPYPAPVHVYDTLESSNRTAKLLALDGAPHGTLVLTAHQSAGRGRLGRKFESPTGKGVYCSILLRPELPAASAQTATIRAAVAVCRAVQKLCGLELAIKWVNDLYYQGKKVCGILTEAGTDLESGRLEWLVVGIGLSREPVPRRARPGAPRRAGRGHRPGAAGPRPRGRLPGRIPRAVLRARALGDGVHRQRDLRGQGPCHRRRRAAGGAAGEWPRGSPALRRGDHPAGEDGLTRVRPLRLLPLVASTSPKGRGKSITGVLLGSPFGGAGNAVRR